MSCSKCAGASVLCYTWKDAELYIVLGQDSNGAQQWSDFGGGLASKWEPESVCALREFKEETLDVFPRRRIIQKVPTIRFHFRDYKGRLRHYTTYLIEVPFQPKLDIQFKTAQIRARCMNVSVKARNAMLEKRTLSYIPFSQICMYKLRPFFKERFQHVLHILNQIVMEKKKDPEFTIGEKIHSVYIAQP